MDKAEKIHTAILEMKPKKKATVKKIKEFHIIDAWYCICK